MLSNLDLIKQCDKFPYRHREPELYESNVASYYKFQVEGCDAVLGWLLPSTVSKIAWPSFWIVSHTVKMVLLTGTSIAVRDARMAETLLAARGNFQVLQKWRNERFPVYGPGRQLLLSIERAASPLFGIMIYGVHMSAYVAQRAANKQTYPGMLDNTVGGGVATGEMPFESIVREAVEEAAIPEGLVRQNAKAVGVVTYFDVRDERAGGETGLLQPECIYVYDLPLPASLIPRPEDMEAENFKLMDVAELQTAGKFKTNCALVIVDFLIRHGIITGENEKDYIEISARLHRSPEFAC
ncbi:uncharacterized protein LY89DRAFT_765537 [Mollisia scopiformis]|uniref:Nudix hydrolase domain-containing protein n=1 Tax=Mollisia scopiformis TaxID=149040 RepID=A0A132B8S4_MOLSC|nr:uncharacterized protein LY89DRAFT_765537 [Mollisia scopiformis]KUJ08067.1 hypothetical protein LY89DRAFT_765537 [Mollisia scopiformis]